MNFSFKRNIFKNLIHSVRPTSFEELHISGCELARNYYEVLNLKNDCNDKEIRDSFIALAKKYHPDTNPNDSSSHARFIELQRAYSILSTPSRRYDYDMSLGGFKSDGYEVYTTKKGGSNANATEDDYHFDEEFKQYFYRSRQEHYSKPESRVRPLQIALFFMAFTSVGAVVQFFILKQDNEQNFPKPSPSPVPYPNPTDRPFFLRWLYTRRFNDEMEKHQKATAAFNAMKEEMSKQKEEYDVSKLRLAFFKEIGHGAISSHLVPSLIRDGLASEFKKKPSFDSNPTKETKVPISYSKTSNS